MYVGADWDPLDVGETDVFSLNFVNDFNPGEGITAASYSIGVIYGNDPNPNSCLIGGVGVSGTIISQTVTGTQPGVIYRLKGFVFTNAGRQISLWSHFACQQPT